MEAKLQTNTIHCTKTGLALFGIDNAEQGIARLNDLLKQGILNAGRHIAKLFLSEQQRDTLKSQGTWNGKTFGWCRMQRDGTWKQYQGWTIGQHNEAVLNAFGIVAEVGTLGVKSCDGRRYCKAGSDKDPAIAKPKAKPKAPVVTNNVPLFGGSAKTETVLQTVEVPTQATSQETPKGSPWPVDEMGTHGGFVKHQSRVGKQWDLTKGQAKVLWNLWKDTEGVDVGCPVLALRKAKQAGSATFAMLCKEAGLSPKVHQVPTPAKPKAVQSPTGTTVKVHKDLFAQMMETLDNPRVVGFDGDDVVIAL